MNRYIQEANQQLFLPIIVIQSYWIMEKGCIFMI